jgi:large subunit ribosomal protein L15
MLNKLSPARGSKKSVKRVGRGPGSGHGKTSCGGHKGAKARSGSHKGAGFEGGQMPLQRRVPKKGFPHEPFVTYVILNLQALAVFSSGEEVSPETLHGKGVIRRVTDRVKVLAQGDIAVPLTLRVHKISEAARRKVEEAGGKVEVLA